MCVIPMRYDFMLPAYALTLAPCFCSSHALMMTRCVQHSVGRCWAAQLEPQPRSRPRWWGVPVRKMP